MPEPFPVCCQPGHNPQREDIFEATHTHIHTHTLKSRLRWKHLGRSHWALYVLLENAGIHLQNLGALDWIALCLKPYPHQNAQRGLISFLVAPMTIILLFAAPDSQLLTHLLGLEPLLFSPSLFPWGGSSVEIWAPCPTSVFAIILKL